MQNTVPSPAPGATSSVPDVQWGPSQTTRAAVKTLPTKKGSCRKISPLLLHPESRASASAHRAGPQ